MTSDGEGRGEHAGHGRHELGGADWDPLLDETGEDSRLTPLFVALLTIACLLAAVGIATGSTVTIVGAMVVSPDFGPLAALAVAGATGHPELARRALRALGVGFALAMAATTVMGLIARGVGADLSAVTESSQISFVYRVGGWSVLVALLAGAAGTLALTSHKSGPLVGVFISVTTVPAAACVTLAAVIGEWQVAGEALLQLLVNMTGVVVAAVIVLWLRRERLEESRRRAISGAARRP